MDEDTRSRIRSTMTLIALIATVILVWLILSSDMSKLLGP